MLIQNRPEGDMAASPWTSWLMATPGALRRDHVEISGAAIGEKLIVSPLTYRHLHVCRISSRLSCAAWWNTRPVISVPSLSIKPLFP